MNNFMNGRRCSVCARRQAIEARRKKLEMKANSRAGVPRRDAICPLVATDKSAKSADQVKPEWLARLDEMRKNLKSAKKHTYRE